MTPMLGRRPSRPDSRNLRLSTYFRGIHAPPPMRNWLGSVTGDLGWYRNAELGTCGLASCAHLIRAWTACNSDEVTLTDEDVVGAYSAVSGYTPDDPSSDQGVEMLDVLKYWRATGIGGRKIKAYVKLDDNDSFEVRVAANVAGGVYVGARLPLSARNLEIPWGTHDGPLVGDDAVGSWGGHAMALLGYDRTWVTFATWGQRQRATWPWFAAYCDEAWAVLSDDWARPEWYAPNGIDTAALERDLEAL